MRSCQAQEARTPGPPHDHVGARVAHPTPLGRKPDQGTRAGQPQPRRAESPKQRGWRRWEVHRSGQPAWPAHPAAPRQDQPPRPARPGTPHSRARSPLAAPRGHPQQSPEPRHNHRNRRPLAAPLSVATGLKAGVGGGIAVDHQGAARPLHRRTRQRPQREDPFQSRPKHGDAQGPEEETPLPDTGAAATRGIHGPQTQLAVSPRPHACNTEANPSTPAEAEGRGSKPPGQAPSRPGSSGAGPGTGGSPNLARSRRRKWAVGGREGPQGGRRPRWTCGDLRVASAASACNPAQPHLRAGSASGNTPTSGRNPDCNARTL